MFAQELRCGFRTIIYSVLLGSDEIGITCVSAELGLEKAPVSTSQNDPGASKNQLRRASRSKKSTKNANMDAKARQKRPKCAQGAPKSEKWLQSELG